MQVSRIVVATCLVTVGCHDRQSELSQEQGSPTIVACPTSAQAQAAQPTALARSSPAQVGAVAGTFSVSQGGAATYAMPLWTPPGRAGMEPQLSVAYDSSSGEGT